MVQITSYKKCKVDKDIIIDFTPDIPKKDFNPSITPFGFMGWIAVGGAYKFDTIEIYSKDQLIQSIPINMRRPDVAKLFPENPAGDRLGFFRYFNAFLLPQIFEITIFAISNNTEKLNYFA